jgi:transportin-1
MIRNAAAQDIVAFLGILEPKNWPECLTLLVNQLDEQDALHQEVCFISPHV